MRYVNPLLVALLICTAGSCKENELQSCIDKVLAGSKPIAETRNQRFEGKVSEDTARCRGGEKAVEARSVPWLDWANYYGTGEQSARSSEQSDFRGIGGALLDIERERVELIRFNLFDNSGTFPEYIVGRFCTQGGAT